MNRPYRIFGWILLASLAMPTIAQTVKTDAVKKGDFTPAITAVGTLEPIGLVEVGPQVAGTIARLGKNVEYRDHVDNDAVLFQLDDSFLKVRLEQEQSHTARLEAELQQVKAKRDAAKDDPAAVKTADAELRMAEAALNEQKGVLKEAQMNLDAAVIKSPVRGMILQHSGEVGQAVGPNPNGPAMFLIWPEGNRIQVWAPVGETDIRLLEPGQPAKFTCPGLPGKAFTGRVARVRPMAVHLHEPTQFTVEIDVDNRDGVLLPDLTAEARIGLAPRQNVMTAPNAALDWLPQSELLAAMRRQASGAPEPAKRHRVWVQEGKVARPIEVKLGPSDGERTEIISSDLKEGDQVIVEGALQ